MSERERLAKWLEDVGRAKHADPEKCRRAAAILREDDTYDPSAPRHRFVDDECEGCGQHRVICEPSGARTVLREDEGEPDGWMLWIGPKGDGDPAGLYLKTERNAADAALASTEGTAELVPFYLARQPTDKE